MRRAALLQRGAKSKYPTSIPRNLLSSCDLIGAAEPYALKTSGKKLRSKLPLFEISLVFVRLDHVARRIVNADHSIM
jgi:hypothetical protein